MNGGVEMKIKEVCEKTELTSRTIRLYIEEKLIFPEYTENYLGRKSYKFSDVDIKNLLNIATLRKYGFSISEIRQIIETKNNSSKIIKEICNRKELTIENEKQMLSALSQLNDGELYSIDEIANVLNSCNEKRDLPQNDTMSPFLLLLKNPEELIAKSVALADKVLLLISFGISLFFIIYFFSEYKYPHIYNVPEGLFALFLTSIPAFIIFIMWCVTRRRAKISPERKSISGIGFISTILILISLLPICFIGIGRPVESLTTDMKNYGKIDEIETSVFKNSFYNELFPTVSGGGVRVKDKWTYPDTKYFYRCRGSFDFTIDIFAEWSLKEDRFIEEVERVKKLYSAYELLDEEEDKKDYIEYYKYTELQKGNYKCLIRYTGGIPFAEEEDSYYYFIFAYDEVNLRVRYILSYSLENGADQPYYLELDW